jgi:trehalose/maltose transport system permease protein
VSVPSPALAAQHPPARVRGLERLADPGERTLAVLLLAPAALLLALIVAYPIGRLVHDAFFDLRLSGGQRAPFVGFANFASALQDDIFWNAVWVTVSITAISTIGALLVGLGLALLANLPYRVKWPVRLALLLPWAMPLAFAGLIFAWFFNTDYGVVNDWLVRLGLAPRSWLLSPGTAYAAVCITLVWKSASFIALILLAGLQMIPRSLYEAAEVDGATRFQQFREVTLPLLVPSIVVALIFRTIAGLQTFDIPYTMTKGGPAHATQTLAMLIHDTTIDYGDIGYGSALAVLMFLLSMVVTAVYLRRVQRD